MKAIILAAGLGSRLTNLTSNKPKALVKVNGVTMLENVIQKLKQYNVSSILINIHHYGDQIIEFLHNKKFFNIDIQISDERGKLLNTGGAILKAADFIKGNQPVIIHNVDILSDLPIDEMLNYHISKQNIATLSVRKRDSSRYLLFDECGLLVGWKNNKTGESKWVKQVEGIINKYAFSGIYLIEPEFVKKITQKGSFSIIDTWLQMAINNRISAFIDNSETWYDLGTIEKIKSAEENINNYD